LLILDPAELTETIVAYARLVLERYAPGRAEAGSG
jgi:hypothetical protein